MSETTQTPKATRREWIGLAVLALPCLLYSMDLTVLNLAVPSISADLQPSASQLLWIIDIYGFLVAGSLITMGALGDRIGRRRLLMIGAACFGVTSILAAFSTSAEMLIASRALLGLSGATLAPSTLSLIRNMFLDPQQRTVAISVWITSYSAGAAVGPPLGGILLEFFWWGSVFLLAVPVMVLLLVVGPRLLPEFKDPNAGKPDLLSAGLSLVAVLTIIYGLKQIAQDGFESQSAAIIAFGLTVGALFVRRQQTLADPQIDLRLLKRPAFSASLATYMLGGLVMFGSFVFVAQYLQLVLGLSPLEAGLWTMPFAIAFVAGSMVTPAIVSRFRPAYVMSIGLVIGAIGFGLMSQVDESTGLWLLIPAMVVSSLGLAPVFTLTTDMIIGTAPPERAGAAAAISETSAEFGGAMGIAVLGSIGAAIYRNEMESAVPAGVSAEAAESARSTLGGALAVAQQLPGDLGVQLITTAQDAFARSLELASLLSVVVMTLLAVQVIVFLRKVEVSGSEGEPEAGTGEFREPELALAGVPVEAD
jgi:DHA2 family multidrug resistance protein-like MFS transporter